MTTLVCSIRNICRWLDLIVQNGVSCNWVLLLMRWIGLIDVFPAVSYYTDVGANVRALSERKGEGGKLTGPCILTDNINDGPLFSLSFIIMPFVLYSN